MPHVSDILKFSKKCCPLCQGKLRLDKYFFQEHCDECGHVISSDFYWLDMDRGGYTFMSHTWWTTSRRKYFGQQWSQLRGDKMEYEIGFENIRHLQLCCEPYFDILKPGARRVLDWTLIYKELSIKKIHKDLFLYTPRAKGLLHPRWFDKIASPVYHFDLMLLNGERSNAMNVVLMVLFMLEDKGLETWFLPVKFSKLTIKKNRQIWDRHKEYNYLE